MEKPLIINFLLNSSFYKKKIYLLFLLCVLFITCNFDKEESKFDKEESKPNISVQGTNSFHPIKITSTDFTGKKNISNLKASPQLSWDVVPEASSYMIFLINSNEESIHWLSYNIVNNPSSQDSEDSLNTINFHDNDELYTLIEYSLPKPPIGNRLNLSFVVVALDKSSLRLNKSRIDELGNLVMNLMKPDYLENPSSTTFFQDNSPDKKSVNIVGLGKIDAVVDNPLYPITVTSTDFTNKGNINKLYTSPQLSWDAVPGASSYMVFFFNTNKKAIHWLSYNITINPFSQDGDESLDTINLHDNQQSLDTLIEYSLPKPLREDVFNLSFFVVALDKSSLRLDESRSDELGDLVMSLMKPDYLENTTLFQDNSSPGKDVRIIGLGKIDTVVDNPPPSLHPIAITSTDFTNKGNINKLYNSPQLSWDAVPGASSYMIFFINNSKESIRWLSYNVVNNSLDSNDESIDTLIEYSLPKPLRKEVFNLSFFVVALDKSSLRLDESRSDELGDLVMSLMKPDYLENPSSTTLFQDNSSPGKDVRIIGLGKIDAVVDNPPPSLHPIAVTSTDFADKEKEILIRGNISSFDISPQLSWDAVPGASSYMVFSINPSKDAVHWLSYNIVDNFSQDNDKSLGVINLHKNDQSLDSVMEYSFPEFHRVDRVKGLSLSFVVVALDKRDILLNKSRSNELGDLVKNLIKPDHLQSPSTTTLFQDNSSPGKDVNIIGLGKIDAVIDSRLHPITIESTDFRYKGNINKLYTSPQLSWNAVPGASSHMAFLINTNSKSIYWLSYNIGSPSLNKNEQSIDYLIRYSLPKPPEGEFYNLSFVVVALDKRYIVLNESRSNELGDMVLNLLRRPSFTDYLQGYSFKTIFQDNFFPVKDVNIIGLGKTDVVVGDSSSLPPTPLVHSITVTSTDFINKGNISRFNNPPQLSWDVLPGASSYMVFLIDSNKESIHWLTYNVDRNFFKNEQSRYTTPIRYSLPKPLREEVFNLSFVVVALDKNSLSLNSSKTEEISDMVLNLIKPNSHRSLSSTTNFQDSSSPSKDVNIIGLGKIDGFVNNPSSFCPNMKRTEGLLISEISRNWMELVNTSNVPICLGDYQFRSFKISWKNLLLRRLPIKVIAPGEYIIVRFDSAPYKKDVLLKRTSSLFNSFYEASGSVELVFENRSADFVAFCNSSGGTERYLRPLSGVFTGCVNFSSAPSITRDYQLTDRDSAKDWRRTSIMSTYGGPNDVDDLIDTDRDGIPDANEKPGTTFVGMPVYDWGARVGHRDIFVHINYMAGWRKKRGLDPREDSLNKIKKVFKDNGFYIHFDTGNRHSATVNPARFNLSGKSHEVPFSEGTKNSPSAADDYKYEYFPNPKRRIFQHVLFAHAILNSGSTTSMGGIGDIRGKNVVLFMTRLNWFGVNSTGTKNFIASVLFHELGHNYGFLHGGNVADGYKPNYLSSMNYLYGDKGLPVRNNRNQNNFFNRYREDGYMINFVDTDGFIINYSYGDMEDLDENSLQEKNPLPTGGFGDVDWNKNGRIDSTSYPMDINGGGKTVLRDYNEWGNLRLPFDYGGGGHRSLEIPLALGGKELDSHNSLGRAPKKYNFYNQDKPPVTIECEFPGLERFKKTFYSNPDPDKD